MRVTPLLLPCLITCTQAPRHRATLEFREAQDQPGAGFTETVEGPRKLYVGVPLGRADVVAASCSERFGAWTIQMELSKEGADAFEAATARLYQRRLAVLLNGKVLMSPRVMMAISGGHLQITGAFKEAEARALVQDLSPRP